jgi:hypothetical protein
MSVNRSQQFHDKGGSRTLTADAPYPDECPACHRSIVPKWLVGAIIDNTHLQACFQCTSNDCSQVFVAYYSWTANGNVVRLSRCAPVSPRAPAVSDQVSTLSPRFTKIYAEAFAAEAHDLTELTGMGLRKSLEFLVKDFAIKQHPSEAAAVRAALLGECIKKYIDDPNVKFLASKSAWLGNDETHYEPRNPDFSIDDLKALLQLMLNAVTNVLLTEHYKAKFSAT